MFATVGLACASALGLALALAPALAIILCSIGRAQFPDLFDDLVHIFSGRQVEEQFESDISVVLHPLPRVPMMICYWKPDDGMESSLNLFFDKVADDNLNIGSVFSLGAGMAQMFAKLAQRHGFPEAASFR